MGLRCGGTRPIYHGPLQFWGTQCWLLALFWRRHSSKAGRDARLVLADEPGALPRWLWQRERGRHVAYRLRQLPPLRLRAELLDDHGGEHIYLHEEQG